MPRVVLRGATLHLFEVEFTDTPIRERLEASRVHWGKHSVDFHVVESQGDWPDRRKHRRIVTFNRDLVRAVRKLHDADRVAA